MNKYLIPLLILVSFLHSDNEFRYGMGISNVSAPLYIGTSKKKNYTIPFPYISLKSKYLNIKRSRIFTNLYDSKRSQIELSLSALPPVSSKNSLRDGMKDLDAILQIGPKYTYSFFDDEDTLKFELPLRFAFSVGDELFYYKGYIADIDFRYSKTLFDTFKLSYITGVSFNSKQINSYYYDVDDKYATAQRSKYKSNGGYAGFHNSFALTKRERHYWFGLFYRHYNLNNVEFEDSSLVETKKAVYKGFAFSYIF